MLHYTKSDYRTYIKKLKFRVINNVFDSNGSGYSARAMINKKLCNRRFLFPVYAISIAFPLIDGIKMCIYYKHPIYLMHPVFSFYVLIQIVFQYLLKFLGLRSVNNAYG